MTWETPGFVEVRMDAELTAYADDFDGIGVTNLRLKPSAALLSRRCPEPKGCGVSAYRC
jgi:hypothetical protein